MKKQVPLATELGELRIGQIAQGDVAEDELIIMTGLEFFGEEGIKVNGFNDAIGQHTAGNVL